MNNKKITWRYLKAFHELYLTGQTRSKITDNGFVKNYLISQKKLVKYRSGNLNILVAEQAYKHYYEQNLKADFERFEAFLKESGLETDARKHYTEDDIATLMFISEHRDDLIKNLSTIRTFSSEIFKGKGSKYLENRSSLKRAVCAILGIDDFPDKDPKNLQWRLVVDCPNPKLIVLCENVAFLKSPWKTRERDVELWYVGGNNIGIIEHIGADKLSKPIYYSCDWDYHGLSIYSRIKKMLLQKGVQIKILKPYTMDGALPVDSPHHNSLWNPISPFSGLVESDFDESEKTVIRTLIMSNKWIEEESLDLLQLIKTNIYDQAQFQG